EIANDTHLTGPAGVAGQPLTDDEVFQRGIGIGIDVMTIMVVTVDVAGGAAAAGRSNLAPRPGEFNNLIGPAKPGQTVVPTPIPGDADFIGPVRGGSWKLTLDGEGAHLIERVNLRGRPALSALDSADTPRYYPSGTP